MRFANMGLGLSVPARNQGPQSFLGASLLAYWDAEQADTLSLTGASVNSWRDVVTGNHVTQSFGAAKPMYSATSFNGRPGLTHDGVDDCLEMSIVPFPTGAAACEIWVLCDRTAAGSDTSIRGLFCYGGESGAAARRLLHQGISGVGRALSVIGDGSSQVSQTNSDVDLFGRHVVRSIVTGSSVQTRVDATISGTSAVVPATGSTRVRIGANTSAAASQFHQGVISAILVIDPTKPEWTPDAQARLLAYLKARGGIA